QLLLLAQHGAGPAGLDAGPARRPGPVLLPPQAQARQRRRFAAGLTRRGFLDYTSSRAIRRTRRIASFCGPTTSPSAFLPAPPRVPRRSPMGGKQLNAKLLFRVLAALAVGITAVHLIHQFQVGRHARGLFAEAAQADADGRLDQAAAARHRRLS